MIRWLARNLALYAVLLAAACLTYWLWYDDAVTARSVIGSVITSVGLPTMALSVLLYPTGRSVSPAVYRLAAVTVALLGGCVSLLGDRRVLTVQLITQLMFGLLVSSPRDNDEWS